MMKTTRYLIEEQTIPMVVLDSQFRVLFANRAFKGWLKIESEREFLHQPLTNFLQNETKLDKLLQQPGLTRKRISFKNQHGEILTAELTNKIHTISEDDSLFQIHLELLPVKEPSLSLNPGYSLLEKFPLPCLLLKVNQGGEVQWFNREFEAVFGKAGQLFKKNLLSETSSLSTFQKQLVSMLSSTKDSFVTNRLLPQVNGQEGYFEIFAQRELQGDQEQLFLVFKDISNEVKKDELIFNLKRLLSDFQHVVNIGYWSYNLSTNKVNWSEGVYKILSSDPSLQLPSTKVLLEKIHPDDLEVFNQYIEDAVLKRKAFNLRFRLVSNEGKVLQVSTSGHYEYDFKDRCSYIRGVVREVTEEYAVLEELALAKEKHRVSSQIARVGTFDWFPLSDKMEWNEDLSRLLKFSSGIQSGSFDVLLNKIKEPNPEGFKQQLNCLKEGEEDHLYLHCKVEDEKKQLFRAFLSLQIVERNQQAPIKVVGVLQDVSAQQMLQSPQQVREIGKILSDVKDAVILTNEFSEISFLNSEALLLFACEEKEALGKKIEDFFKGKLSNTYGFRQTFEKLVEKGSLKEEVTLNIAQREPQPIFLKITLLEDDKSFFKGLVITARPQTEARGEKTIFLDENNSMVNMVLNTIPSCSFIVDQHRKILNYNHVFLKMAELNSPKEEKDFHLSALQNTPLETIINNINQVFITQEEETIIHKIEGQKGERWFEVYLLPFRDPQAAVIGVLSILNDINDRFLHQEAILEKEKNLSAIIESTDQSICYLDEDYKIKTLNNSFKRFVNLNFGIPIEEGNFLLNQLPENWALPLREIFDYVMLGNKLSTERKMYLKESFEWFEFICNPVTIKNRITGFSFSFKNISEKKRQEESSLNRKIQQEKMKSLAIIQGQEEERKRVSMELHDGVGQLLTALQMQASYLSSQGDELPEKIGLKIIKLEEMVKAAKQEIRRISFNLMPSMLSDFGLYDSLSHLLSMMFGETDLKASSFIGNGLKNRFQPEVEIGVFRIAQEIFNNCIKHSEANSVMVRSEFKNDTIHFSFSDNGKGFDGKLLAHYRKHGNGISNITQRAHLLNGEVSIKTSEGGGCHYSILIPGTPV